MPESNIESTNVCSVMDSNAQTTMEEDFDLWYVGGFTFSMNGQFQSV